MAFPARGPWQFHNVTRGYDFWPTLDSINVSQTEADDLATWSFDLVDETSSITMAEEDRVWAKFDGVFIFGGHVKTLTMTERSEVGPRSYSVECQDFTAKLDDSVIDHQKSRASEDVADRVAWILTFLNYPITATAVALPSFTCGPGEFLGMTVREALDATADEARLHYYVDFDRDLHMARNEVITAPFGLNDDDPDYVTDFPFSEWDGHSRDSVELATAIYVQGDKREDWVENASAIALYGRQERSLQDSELITAAQITAAGNRALAENDAPHVTGTLVCHQPGIQGGMTFALTSVEWGSRVNGTYIATGVTLEAVDPHDQDGSAYLKATISYADRRRARPYRHRVKKPSSASLVVGAAVAFTRYGLESAVDRDDSQGGLPDDFGFGTAPPATTRVLSSAALATPYIFVGCPFGESGYSGVMTNEQWLEVTGTPTADAVFLRVTYTVGPIQGVAATGTLQYGVAHAAPTAPYQYEVLGTCPVADGSFDVPVSALTGTDYLVLGPVWVAGDLNNQCANTWGGGPPLDAGAGNSGAVTISTLALHEVEVAGAGLTPWRPMSGAIDGLNRVFDLPDWNGKAVPDVRIGGVPLSYGPDYDVDPDTGEITTTGAPWEGADLLARWRT